MGGWVRVGEDEGVGAGCGLGVGLLDCGHQISRKLHVNLHVNTSQLNLCFVIMTLAEHTSDHGKQTNSNTNEWGEGN